LPRFVRAVARARTVVDRKSLREVVAELGARQKFIKPHCPWQNGKVERLNRTLQTEWAYRQVFTSNADRAAALAPGSSTATLNDATAHSEANHPSAACYQPDGSVHPAPVWLSGASRSGAAAALLRGALGEGPERH
jgi:transposase InsO family protein